MHKRQTLLLIYIILSYVSHTLHAKENCGPSIWCYYPEIYPSNSNTVEQEVIIEDGTVGPQYFEVYFTPIGGDCLSPKISFNFELIDYDASTEYLDIIDDDDVLITTCNGGEQNACPDRSECLINYELTSKILEDQSYRIRIEKPSAVTPFCFQQGTSDEELSINAELLLTCDPLLGSSTTTLLPITEPSTLVPTPSPTITPKRSCGIDYWCYDIDMYPIAGIETSETIIIANTDDLFDTNFAIYIHINDLPCIDPEISFTFEEIDFANSQAGAVQEYLSVYDDDGTHLKKCLGTQDSNCNNWIECLKNRKVRTNIIYAGDTYIITIFEPESVDALCTPYHPYSIHALFTFHCSAQTVSPTPTPTNNPTPSPTPSPTFNPTNAPTNDPTHAPTYNPTASPTPSPSINPTDAPTLPPTTNPTNYPSMPPSFSPTFITINPTINPSKLPTMDPTVAPSFSPTNAPTRNKLVIRDKPTMSPAIIMSTLESDESTKFSNEDESNATESNSGGFVAGNYYILIGIVSVLVCICMVGCWIVYVMRKKKLKTEIRIANDNGEIEMHDMRKVKSLSTSIVSDSSKMLEGYNASMNIITTEDDPDDDIYDEPDNVIKTPMGNVQNGVIIVTPNGLLETGSNTSINENEMQSQLKQQEEEEDDDDQLYDNDLIIDNNQPTTTGGNEFVE